MYLLENNSNNKTYLGITTDMDKRLKKHNGLLSGGAKYTRAFKGDGEWILKATVTNLTSSLAKSYESTIKKIKKPYKKGQTPLDRRIELMMHIAGENNVNIVEDDYVDII